MTLDFDATLITAYSEKQDAAPTSNGVGVVRVNWRSACCTGVECHCCTVGAAGTGDTVVPVLMDFVELSSTTRYLRFISVPIDSPMRPLAEQLKNALKEDVVSTPVRC